LEGEDRENFMYQLGFQNQPRQLTPDEYVILVLNKYAVDFSKVSPHIDLLMPTVNSWGNAQIVESIYSGSIAKGTCISLCADADIFISLSSSTTESLATIYNSLFNAVVGAGYRARKQNVSIGVFSSGFQIDLVPGKRQNPQGYDHSLYKNKTGTWTKTNIKSHVSLIQTSNRISEIRLAKIWRERNKLDFPSFYLELAVIDFFKGSREQSLSTRFWSFLEFLSHGFILKKYIDPANSNNIVSDDLTVQEKLAIKNAADKTRKMTSWGTIVW
jgi:hypothetical protein